MFDSLICQSHHWALDKNLWIFAIVRSTLMVNSDGVLRYSSHEPGP